MKNGLKDRIKPPRRRGGRDPEEGEFPRTRDLEEGEIPRR